MTGKINNNEIYRIDHTTFGGIIYASDFNTYYQKENIVGSKIAKRIMDDKRFDRQCRKKYKK